MKDMTLLSFIIPCYGSEKTILSVVDELIYIVNQNKEYDYEIIAVNDCSPDNVWMVLTDIAEKNPKIKLIDFAKNSNRPAAVMAGLTNASGDICVIMDDDGQCPINELWRLIKPLNDDYDVSIASYTKRKQSIFKNMGTFLNNKMTEIIIDRPKNMQFTNFMAIKKFIAEKIVEYQNPYPYLTGLLLRTTQRIVNVPMEQRERIDNKRTTFTIKKMISLWLNGLTAFSVKPLRIATVIGIFCSLSGFVYGIYMIINKIINPNIPLGYSSLVVLLLFIGGLLLMMLGIIGEYIGRIYISINNAPQYVIRKKVNFTNEK